MKWLHVFVFPIVVDIFFDRNRHVPDRYVPDPVISNSFSHPSFPLQLPFPEKDAGTGTVVSFPGVFNCIGEL